MTAKLFGDIKAGDRLFRVLFGRNARDAPRSTGVVEVTKVGRKWAEFGTVDDKWRSGGRFNIENGFIDGGGFSSPGAIYRTETEWREHEEAKQTWREFMRCTQNRWSPVPGVTKSDILHAAVLLKLDLKP